MPQQVLYAFSFHSPYSALADTQIDALVVDAGCVLEPLPLVPPSRPDEPEGLDGVVQRFKADYIVEDAARWAQKLGMAWNPPPPPVRFAEAIASTAAWFYALDRGGERAFRNAVFRARFGEGLDTEDEGVLRECARAAGLDPAAVVEAAGCSEHRARGPALLPRMGAEKVFGVPLFVVAGQRFFGNDRLDFLREALGSLASEV